MSPINDYLKRKNQYNFNNTWNINAPLKLIWNELLNYENWPVWCNSLEKIEPLEKFNHLEKGNNFRSVWKGSLPYSLCFDAVIKDFNLYSFLAFNVTGDLYGDGICHFLPSNNKTRINFIWNVSPTKLWMKMSSSFARSVFMENHDQIIEQSITCFSRMIEQKISQKRI